MRSRYFLLVLLVLVLLGVSAGGVYAFDKSHSDKIAKGVTVGGVPVGGLTPAEARAKLKAQILDPLRRPIVVHRAAKTWHLTAREARISADLDTTVDEALARSRQGSLLERVWREVRGQRLDARLQPTVTYSKPAVVRLLHRVAKSVDRDPRDAKVTINGAGVSSVPARPGREVRTVALRRQIRAAMTDPTARRTFSATTTRIDPKVTTADAEKKYGTVIVVNRSAFRLTLYKHLKMVKTYPIAVGQVGLETPAGLYSITNKAVNPAWHVPNSAWAGSLAGQVISGDDPSNPIKARWLGVYDGVGVHGTSDDGSIGSAASHGCIRMHIPDVVDLYDRVPVGSPIYIA